MSFDCWLCPSKFEKKRDLKLHLGQYFHRRLSVICPWCQNDVTHARIHCLKSHTARAHPQVKRSLPVDFFTEGNGYYMSVYPLDYQRVLKPGDPWSETTQFTIDLIKKLHEVMPNPHKTMEEWQIQWERVKETEYQQLMALIKSNTSTSASQAAPSNIIVPMKSHGICPGEQSVSEAATTGNTDSADSKSLVCPLTDIDPQLNASQSISVVASTETSVTSSTGLPVPVSHVPPTVLTPPGTPTPIMMANASSQIIAVSAKHGHGLTQGSDRQTARAPVIADPNTIRLSCDICGLLFQDENSLRSHKETHCAPKPFQCSLCGSAFAHRRTCTTHMKSVHGHVKGEPRKRHPCPVCKRIFYLRDKLRVHALNCNTNAPILNKANERLYQCAECLRTFKTKNSLDIHRHTHANSKFRCPLCNKSFPRVRFLKCHVVKGHNTDLMTLAKSGNKKAELLLKVKQHFPRPFGCKLCGKRFEKLVHQKVHMRSHKKDRHIGDKNAHGPFSLFRCKHCDSSFVAEYLLAKHLLNDHPTEEVTASISDNNDVQANTTDTYTSFANTETLPRSKPAVKTSERTAQFKRHTTPWSRSEYKCDICGSKFDHRHSLTRHIMSHLEDGDTDDRAQAMEAAQSIKTATTRFKSINNIPYRNRPGYTKMGVAADDVRIESLGEEIKDIANGKTKYRCKVCLAKFNSHSDLMEHMTLKAGYHCKEFTKQLSKLIYNSLPVSKRETYQCCEICGLFYTCRYSLLKHTLRHSKASSQTVAYPSMKRNYYDVNRTESTDRTLREIYEFSDIQYGNETNKTLNIKHTNPGNIDPQIEIVTDKEQDIGSDSEIIIQNQNIRTLQNEEESVTCRAEHVPQHGSFMNASLEQDFEDKTNEFVYVFDSVEVESQEAKEIEGQRNCNASETVSGNSLNLYDPSLSNIEPDSAPTPNERLESKASPLGAGIQESATNENTEIQASSINFKNRRQISDNDKADNENTENSNVIENVIKGNRMSTTSLTSSTRLEEKDKPVYKMIDTDESCNDYNSSDEDIVFGEDTVSRDRDIQQDLPVGTNKECMQCQIPFIEKQVTVTCHLCCKRYCRPCSQIPRRVYREAFRGPSFGLVWMCKVCKPAFPTYMTLLHQLGQFEDVVNKRLTNISKRLATAEQKGV